MNSTHRFVGIIALALPPLVLPLTACAASGAEHRSETVGAMIVRGEYAEAVRVAQERARNAPDDRSAQDDHRLATVAYLLDRGRRACFEDRDDEALELIGRARELAPNDRIVNGWYDKVVRKLSDRALARAIDLHMSDDLEAAVVEYERAWQLDNGNVRAKEGAMRTSLQMNYRAGVGDAYYRDGARALSDWYVKQARSYFNYSMKYQPENERAQDRRHEVDAMLAEERCAIAADLEEQGNYAAARNEYRIASILDPDSEVAKAGAKRTQDESFAAKALREAERLMLKRKFDDALAALDKGEPSTKVQGDRFAATRQAIADARLQTQYDLALSYEADYDYERAIEEYDVLLEQVQYFKDAITRRDTLRGHVERATRLYDQALAATDQAEQVTLLKSIEVFWPDYRDVRDRLKALGALQRSP